MIKQEQYTITHKIIGYAKEVYNTLGKFSKRLFIKDFYQLNCFV